MSPRPCNVVPIHCGVCQLGQNHVLGDPYSDEDRMEFTCYAFLADGGPGRLVLVDLGSVGLGYLNAMFQRFGFFRDRPDDPDAIVQPHGNIFDGLARLGLRPPDIDHVVFTHLHADHHGLTDGRGGGAIEQFAHARLHVSKIGWEFNLARRKSGRWSSYLDHGFGDFLLRAERAGRLICHDNEEVVPGVDVIHLGGHAPCSQAVRVLTSAGPAIITSDEIYHYGLLRDGVMGRLFTTPQNQQRATERLVQLALDGAILIPCHEPALHEDYQRYGNRWLDHSRARSDDAARGFFRSVKRVVGATSARGDVHDG